MAAMMAIIIGMIETFITAENKGFPSSRKKLTVSDKMAPKSLSILT